MSKRTTVMAAVAAVLAFATACNAMPAQAAQRAPRTTTSRGADLKPLWSRFPLGQARGGSSSRPATTTGPRAVIHDTAAAQPRSTARSGATTTSSRSSGSDVWLFVTGFVLVLVAAVIAWRHARGGAGPERTAKKTARPRGLDLLIDAPELRQTAPATAAEPVEPHIVEGSEAMRHERQEQEGALVSEDAAPESYGALGARVASVLESAQAAADDILRAARQEADEMRAEAERYGEDVRRRADADADAMRAGVEGEVARIVAAAEARARRIEENALQRRDSLVTEARSLQDLLDERRRWLRGIIATFRDVTDRLEDAVPDTEDADATDSFPQDLDAACRQSSRTESIG